MCYNLKKVIDLWNRYLRYVATEESGFAGRALCNPNHALKLHVRADDNTELHENILEITRPYRCLNILSSGGCG